MIEKFGAPLEAEEADQWAERRFAIGNQLLVDQSLHPQRQDFLAPGPQPHGGVIIFGRRAYIEKTGHRIVERKRLHEAAEDRVTRMTLNEDDPCIREQRVEERRRQQVKR